MSNPASGQQHFVTRSPRAGSSTASPPLGAVCGMFGLIAVVRQASHSEAILWLAVAMVLDGVDGPAARAWSVQRPRAPHRRLHPRPDRRLRHLHRHPGAVPAPVHMLPDGWSLYIGAFVLFMSALWMSRTDQMTDDHFFNGFPCEWNMIVPTLYLLRRRPVVHRRRLRAAGAHPAHQLEVRPPDAGAALPAAHHHRHRRCGWRRCCAMTARPARTHKPALGTASADRLPAVHRRASACGARSAAARSRLPPPKPIWPAR